MFEILGAGYVMMTLSWRTLRMEGNWLGVRSSWTVKIVVCVGVE